MGMENPWTRMGESRDGGPTHWSILLAAKDSAAGESRSHLDRLIRTYWRPVYAYLRIHARRNNEDAKDLTQSFFADLLEHSVIARADRERGRFRTFLRTCLENFVRGQHRAATALKRGGGAAPQSLDFIVSEESTLEPADERTPEEIFDREWERAVLTQAIQALREEYANEDREVYFRVFEAYDMSSDPNVSYGAIASKLQIRESDVTNYLAHARARLRALAEEIVRQSVASSADVGDELERVFPSE